MRWLAVAALLGGCDFVWRIDHFDPPRDAATDAPSDALDDVLAVDANCGLHDEDLDNVNDGCDDCPTIMNTGQADGDHDGVGTACDPELGPGKVDHIGLFAAFTDLALFVPTGTPNNNDHETVLLNNNDSLLSVAQIAAPSLVVVQIQNVVGPAISSTFAVGLTTNGIACIVIAKGCASGGGAACLREQSNTTADSPLTMAITSLQEIRLERVGANFQCSVKMGNVMTIALPTPGVMATANLQLSTSGTIAVRLDNAIVYN